MDKKKINKKETGEDATKYGEFVSSFFGWITPKHQKERAEELEKLGKQKSWKLVNWDRVLKLHVKKVPGPKLPHYKIRRKMKI